MKRQHVVIAVLVLGLVAAAWWFFFRKKPAAVAAPAGVAPMFARIAGPTYQPVAAPAVRAQPLPMAPPLAITPATLTGIVAAGKALLDAFGKPKVTAGTPTLGGTGAGAAGCRPGEIFRGGFCATPQYFRDLDAGVPA